MTGTKVDLSFLVPRFLERLGERLRRIDMTLETSPGLTGEPLDALMREFHSMAGIGGTYGFPEVSRLAREAEVLIGVVHFEKRALHAAEMEILRATVARIDDIRRGAAAEIAAREIQSPAVAAAPSKASGRMA